MDTGSRRRPSYYPGEDTSPTTEREIRGWYSYGIAAEVFAISGLGSFLPVTLEQLARENGVLRSDGVTSCVAPKADGTQEKDDACVVGILGAQINTSSFALYTMSLAVLAQALVLISISAIADHGNYRKRFLILLAWLGAASCMGFIFVVPAIYYVAPVLTIISTVCLGNGFALLNSFLPLLVANRGDRALGSESVSDQQLSNQISARGIGLGYMAAVFTQVMAIGILVLMSKLHLTTSSTLPMRFILLLVGAWWAIFTIPTYLWLRDRPGPRLPNITVTTKRWLQPLQYLSFAWKSLFATMKIAFQLKQVVIFLAAWFLMSDAIATISSVAILFARTELHMETAAIALVSITATASGIAGATLWPKIQHHFHLETNHTIIACILLFELVPLYGLLGFLPPIKALGFGGLQQPWEIYPLAFIHGFVMGGLSSFCRSFYGSMIPPGWEASFYALYAVTDKGSSVIGPTVVGRIVDATGTVRMGFWFLAVLIVAPIPLIWVVDGQRGRREALTMAGMLKGEDGGFSLGDGEEGQEEGFGLLSDEDEDEEDDERESAFR